MKILEPIELTERELAFIRFVCEGLAPSAAAVQAGYSLASGPRLMRMPRIVTALQLCAVNAQAALSKVENRKPYGSQVSRDTEAAA